MKSIELKIRGMHCTGCSSRLEKILSKLNGVENVSVNFEKAVANLNYDEEKVSLNEISETIIDAGFEVK